MATIVSDMQAFKAENPNGVLADFVRWYFPACWIPDNGSAEPIVLPPSGHDAESSVISDHDDHGQIVAQLESDAEADDSVDHDHADAHADRRSSTDAAAAEALQQPEEAESQIDDDRDEAAAPDEAVEADDKATEQKTPEEEQPPPAPAQSTTAEQPESIRTVWAGHGRIDESLLMGQDTDWRRLWESATPCPAAEQAKLFNVSQESEKVLNHIETLVPVRWAGELLCAAMASLHFMMQDSCRKYRHVVQVREALHNLTDQINEAIAAVRDDMKKAGSQSNMQEEAVCQRTLVLCDAVCEAIAHIERLCDRLGSLYSLFPDQWRMLGALATEGTTSAINAEEVQAINKYMARCQL